LTVVADAGPLIALAKIDGLEPLFRLYPHVSIPPAVHDEAIRSGGERGATDAVQSEGNARRDRVRFPGWTPVSRGGGRLGLANQRPAGHMDP